MHLPDTSKSVHRLTRQVFSKHPLAKPMPASSKVKDAVSKANTASEDGDYDLALNTLRDAWDDELKKGDQVVLIRTAGMIHMSRGQADDSIRRQAWKDARRNLERAQKLDTGNKETRRQLNSLMSMMDESGIYVGRGFSLFANGEPTPFGLLAMFVSGIILLAIFGQGKEIIDSFGEAESNPAAEGDTVIMTVSYYPHQGAQKVTDDIEIQLYPDDAPDHVASFIEHVSNGMYDGTSFHRVIDNFMIQGGDFQNSDGTGGYASGFYGYCNGQQADSSQDCSPTSYTLPDEADNGLLHESCTISMAKTSQPHTGGSQFFLIPEDSAPEWLDGKHTVFGSILSGCDVVTSISEVPTDDGDRPINPVVLISAVLISE